MNTSDELQAALENWDGTGDPPTLSQVRKAPGFAALSPNGRLLALNQTQKNWADRLYGEDATGYGDNVRLLETDFDNARRDELKNGLAEDLRSGALTEDQVGQYVKGGAAALDGEAARYVQHRFGDDNEIAGPWRTTKMPLEGADGKPVGYAYLRQAPGDGTGPGNGRVEASWVLNGNDGTQIKGTEDVDSTAELESLRRTKTAIETTRQTAYPPGGQPNDARTPELAAGLKLLDLPPEVQPRAVAHRALTAALQNRPEIVDKIGQGFWAGLPGEASKGFLNLGAATVHGPGALFGNRQSLENWKQGTADIEGSIEGQSKLGFEGGTWNNVLKSVSQEALPMVFSMGAGAAASATRRGLSSAVEKTFLSRMAAIELENAGKAGLAQTAAAELTGEGVGAGAKQALTQSLSRGLFGKWLGTAEIESAIGKQLADRVTNAVAFLPSSARSGLQNMTTTLDAAAEARAAGDEKKAQALEDNAVMNAWAGIGMETLSENIWLNEMLITRGGHTLSKVSNDVLARRLGAGRMAALTERAKQFIQRGAKAGVQEGLEENVAGIGNRAWLNEFAAQNQDLLAGATEEFLGGALLGALMGGAKALAQDGKPAAFNELLQRGLSGDDKAMETLADIRRRAENLPDRPAPAEGVVPDPQAAPAAAAPEGSRSGAAATVSPGPAAGSVTRLPGLAAQQNEATPPSPPPVDPNAQDAGGTNVVPPVAPEPAKEENSKDTTQPATMAAPGTVENPPVPDTLETVNEQARLAADKSSSRKAVLITPGTPMPERTPGLKAFQGDSPHGRILYNPKKITPAEVRKAAQGAVFDASILGMSGQETGTGAAVVTASTPAAPNVQAEVVTSQEAVPEAVAAAQQAAPGATVEVKPAAQVAAERKPKRQGPRFERDAERFPLVSGLVFAGVAPLPPGRQLAKWRKVRKGGLRLTEKDEMALSSETGEYEEAPMIAQYKGRPRAQDAIRRMFRAGATNSPDQAFQEAVGQEKAQAAYANGFDLWKEVHRELRELDDVNEDDGEHSEEIRQNAAFYAAIQAGKIQVNAQELRTGDVLDIEGERMKVKHVTIDEDGNTVNVEVQDGRRFGRQLVDGNEALFVEGYEPRPAPEEGDYDAERLVFSRRLDYGDPNSGRQLPDRIKNKRWTVEEARRNPGLFKYWLENAPGYLGELPSDPDRNGTSVTSRGIAVLPDSLLGQSPTQGPRRRAILPSKPLDPFRGDFFAGTDEDVFNLGDELPDDRAKREKRELKERMEREQRDKDRAKAQAAKDQGMLFRKDGSVRTKAPTAAHAQSAVAILRDATPEVLKGVRIVNSPAELNPREYHPDDWQDIATGGVEGFFKPSTRETVIIVSAVVPREGETPIGAVARVILHEQLGHRGLRLAMDNKAFASQWSALTAEIPAEELAELLPLYPDLADDPETLAEEWFARRAESASTAPAGSLLRRMWDAFKQWVGKVWSRFAKGGLTLEQRVREALQASRAALMKGGEMGPEEAMRTSRTAFVEPRPVYGPGKLSWEEIKAVNARFAEWLDRVAEWANTRPENEPIVLEDGEKRTAVVLPSASEPGKWRTTRFIILQGQWEPSGHMVFDTREEAIRDALTKDGFKNITYSVRFSRAPGAPMELRDLPEWIKARLKVRAVGAFTVKNRALRTMLRGDALPKGWQDVMSKAGHETAATVSHMAALARDLQKAMRSYTTGMKVSASSVERMVQLALTGDRVRMLPTQALRETAGAVRNWLDILSDEVAMITGGQLGDAILDNKGHWMRRSYLAFDADAEWNYDALAKAAAKNALFHGRNARQILQRAQARLMAENPALTPAGIEALMRELSDRNALLSGIAGSGGVSKDVSSLMRRRQIPREIRDLMGEVKNPLANALNSASFQAQFIARHDQQRTLAQTGLATGLFAEAKEGRYTQKVGGEDGQDNHRWSGFYTFNAKDERIPLYTTPELWDAMQKAPAMKADELGRGIADAIQTLSGFAKANKVALSPDAAGPQYIGNIVSLVMNGDLLWADGFKNIAQAVKIYQAGKGSDAASLTPVEKALRDTRRQMLTQMTAQGLTNSLSLRDLEVTLDTAMLRFAEGNKAWDKSLGFAHGALLGQSFGRPFGTVGRVVGGAAGAVGGAVAGETRIKNALHFVAQWVVGHPDRIGKMASFLTNFRHQLASGQAREDAFQTAAEKTLNTMPAYEKVPHFIRSLSKYGLLQSFVAFKYELVRNTYWNLRYAVQEIRSGNGAMMARGARRLMGTSAIFSALVWGLPALVQGLFGAGVDDDKDKAYRRWLAAPWEQFANLNYSAFDKEHAAFFNAGYLIPQSMFLEIARLARSEKPLDALGDKIWQDFAEGNVHLDPLMEVIMNAHKSAPDRPITFKSGWQGMLEKLDYYMAKVLEPGASDKLDRVARAIAGRNTSSRTFSLQEEALRLGGFRSYTYRHEPRVRGALYTFKEEREHIAAEARQKWARNGPGDREAAITEANTRLAALAEQYKAFTADMDKLGLKGKAEQLRKEAGYRPGYRLRAGKKGPEAVPQL